MGPLSFLSARDTGRRKGLVLGTWFRRPNAAEVAAPRAALVGVAVPRRVIVSTATWSAPSMLGPGSLPSHSRPVAEGPLWRSRRHGEWDDPLRAGRGGRARWARGR